MLVIAGKRLPRSCVAVISLIKKPHMISEGNAYDSSITAHVVEEIDEDGKRIIDDVVILR